MFIFIDPKKARGGGKTGSSYMRGRSQKKLRVQARRWKGGRGRFK